MKALPTRAAEPMRLYNLYLEGSQLESLKAVAESNGVAMSSLIREAIRLLIEKKMPGCAEAVLANRQFMEGDKGSLLSGSKVISILGTPYLMLRIGGKLSDKEINELFKKLTSQQDAVWQEFAEKHPTLVEKLNADEVLQTPEFRAIKESFETLKVARPRRKK